MSNGIDKRTERFVERMGMLGESEGLPRIAGRIFGLLLVEPGERSLDDLASVLGVSKASISTDARRLEQLGFLERTSRPSDRKDYYSISSDVFARSLGQRLDRMRQFHELIEDARSLPVSPKVRARLDDLDSAYELAVSAVVDVIARWERSRAQPGSRRS